MIYPPKTDWKYEDVINHQDFDRIYRTQLYVGGRIMDRLGIAGVSLEKSGLDSYSALGYASEINKIENNIRQLVEKSGQTAIGYVVESWPGERNPDFTDANRWEENTRRIKVTVYYASLFHPRCGVPACGQRRFWQVRFRNLSGLMWREFHEYDQDWQAFDAQDTDWYERDRQPL